MISNYILYLRILEEKLEGFFEDQKDYIFCKEGCSHCCENGDYPFSELEFKYLSIGLRLLSVDVQVSILNRIKQIKIDKEKSNLGDSYSHICPFLIDNKCSVYNYRGIICRTHGLAFFNEENKIKVPSCVYKNLNYASVYDKKTGKISVKMFEKTGFKKEPISFNLVLNFLLDNETTKELALDFGEEKSLIDWF